MSFSSNYRLMITFNVWIKENIHTTPTEGIRPYDSLRLAFSEIGPQSLSPMPTGIFTNFPHALKILLSHIKRTDK